MICWYKSVQLQVLSAWNIWIYSHYSIPINTFCGSLQVYLIHIDKLYIQTNSWSVWKIIDVRIYMDMHITLFCLLSFDKILVMLTTSLMHSMKCLCVSSSSMQRYNYYSMNQFTIVSTLFLSSFCCSFIAHSIAFTPITVFLFQHWSKLA